MCDLKDIMGKIESKLALENGKESEVLLNDFFQNRIDNALEVTLKKDKRYQDTNSKIRIHMKKIEEIILNRQQWCTNKKKPCQELTVDRVRSILDKAVHLL